LHRAIQYSFLSKGGELHPQTAEAAVLLRPNLSANLRIAMSTDLTLQTLRYPFIWFLTRVAGGLSAIVGQLSSNMDRKYEMRSAPSVYVLVPLQSLVADASA